VSATGTWRIRCWPGRGRVTGNPETTRPQGGPDTGIRPGRPGVPGQPGRRRPFARLEQVTLGRTILSDVLLGRKFPSKAFLLTFVAKCGIDLETDRRWEQAWDRLVDKDPQVSLTGETERSLMPEVTGLVTASWAVLCRGHEVPDGGGLTATGRWPGGSG